MKYILFGGSLVLLWFPLYPQNANLLAVDEYQNLLLSTEEYYLIDVRTRWEYKRSHIEGAQNISFLGLSFRKKAAKLDTAKAVFLYCQTAHRSPFAANILKELGFRDIYDLKGGYNKWKEKGFPVAK